MLTDNDLQNLGLPSVGHRQHLRACIAQLREDNRRERDFPSLLDSARQLRIDAELRRQHRHVRDVQITLVCGVYGRVTACGDYRWKIFVDVDWYDAHDPDNSMTPAPVELHQLIDTVHFQLPHMQSVSADAYPFVIDDWLNMAPTAVRLRKIQSKSSLSRATALSMSHSSSSGAGVDGMNDEQHGVPLVCVVYFADCVLQPRNTRLSATIDTSVYNCIVAEKSLSVHLSSAQVVQPNSQPAILRSSTTATPPLDVHSRLKRRRLEEFDENASTRSLQGWCSTQLYLHIVNRVGAWQSKAKQAEFVNDQKQAFPSLANPINASLSMICRVDYVSEWTQIHSRR
jgi:hypothetical protein